PSASGTEADRLRAQYQALGEEQKHTYGENPPGAKPPDFTKLGNPGAAGPAGYPPGPAGKNPAAPASAPLNAEAGKDSPPAPGSPSVARPAAPAKSGTGGTGPAAGKNPAAPVATPPKTATPPSAESRDRKSAV